MTKRIDIHVHLAGLTGCESGCFVSPRMTRTLTYHGIRKLTGARGTAEEATRAYAEKVGGLLDSSAELDYACIFAMDGVYDAHGELMPDQSHLYVPNAYVFDVAARNAKLLPVISVNPQRRDAIAELEKWGPLAIALKWLGPLQKFDPQDRAHERFYDLLKELGLPLVIHTGCEHTFPGMAQRLGNPALYESVVKRGVPVVFSHCGTGSFMHPGHDYSAEFVTMLERFDNVYGDTSAFCSAVRYKQIRRFAADRYASRIVHGSDWPIPSSALYFLPWLGFDRIAGLERNRHPLDRDVATKRAMGVPESVFTGAYAFLEPRIRRWEAARRSRGFT